MDTPSQERGLVGEQTLLQRAASRDVAVWSQIYEAHYSDVYAYAYSRLGSREEAEDIAAQVFVEALRTVERQARRSAGEKTSTRVLAWLLSLSRDLIQRRERQLARSIRASALGSAAADAGDAEATVERLDLLAALRHLTREQQDAIILRFFLAKTTGEIAALLGKNENAVFALQFRAIKSLRRYLSANQSAHIFRPEAGA